jgi:hypothetical protein
VRLGAEAAVCGLRVPIEGTSVFQRKWRKASAGRGKDPREEEVVGRGDEGGSWRIWECGPKERRGDGSRRDPGGGARERFGWGT